MKNKIIFSLLLLTIAIIFSGCGNNVQSISLTRYHVTSPTNLNPVIRFNEQYYVDATQDYNITFAMFGYKEFIAVDMSIKNKLFFDLSPKDYSIALFDGRDHLPIKLIDRDELALVEKKLIDPKGFNLTSPSVQGVFSSVNSIISMPENSSLGQNIQNIINNYFAFRPIYARSARNGWLAFFHDFKLEYPLILIVKIKGTEYKYNLEVTKKQ